MATITVQVSPDTAAWIAAGYDPTKPIVEVDLSALNDEERALLARHTRVDREMRVTIPGIPGIPEPTAQGILARLREHEAAEAEARRKREEGEREQALRTLRERRTTEREIGLGFSYRVPDWSGTYDREAVRQVGLELATAEDKAWLDTLEAEEKAALAAYHAEKSRIEAEAKIRQEELLQAMREWALTHGSRRAALLVEENHPDWLRVTVEEWIFAHTPEGWSDLKKLEPYRLSERIRPEEADILALREARKLAENSDVLTNPRMAWVFVYHDPIETGADDVVEERFAATVLDLNVPAPSDVPSPLRPARTSVTLYRRVLLSRFRT